MLLLDCDTHEQKRDLGSQVFVIGNTQFNTVYEQLQNTVQLLSNKVYQYLFNAHLVTKCLQVADLEKKTMCQFNGVAYNEGEHWDLSECVNCLCEVCNTTDVNNIETLCI